MQIDITKLPPHQAHLEHLIVEALSFALTYKELQAFLAKADYENDKSLDVKLMVEGVEFPIDVVCEHWQEQVTEMINQQALILIDDKFAELYSSLTEAFDEVRVPALKKVAETLGLTLEEKESHEEE